MPADPPLSSRRGRPARDRLTGAGGGPAAVEAGPGEAWFHGRHARGVVEHVELPDGAARIGAGGFWAVVGDFEGPVRAWRFAVVDRSDHASPPAYPATGAPWVGPPATSWTSSMSAVEYRSAVDAIRERIRSGDVYQVNLCRVLTAPLPAAEPPAAGVPPRAAAEPSAAALAARLARGNPAPYSGAVHVPGGGAAPPMWVVSASPELFLRVGDGTVTSGPIKGTAATAEGLTAKDRAENIMIADMVRNDLQRVCRPGTVEVTNLLALERHPGLVHLVTTVQGQLHDGEAPDWSAILAATYPPASVSGAPKHAALGIIAATEPVPRGPYCGALGWIDADRGQAELAVGIRTFWWREGTLRFGTGAGITWGSDPQEEWGETELKAHRLVGLASAPA